MGILAVAVIHRAISMRKRLPLCSRRLFYSRTSRLVLFASFGFMTVILVDIFWSDKLGKDAGPGRG